MYNSSLKLRFFQSGVTGSSEVNSFSVAIFDAFAPIEERFGADLCTFSAEQMQIAFDSLNITQQGSRDKYTLLLKKYQTWCVSQNVANARVSIDEVRIDASSVIRRTSVSSPLHLQKFLDAVFDPVSLNTIDVMYRCVIWLLYMGLQLDDVLLLNKDAVSLADKMVTCGEKSYLIYPISMETFDKTVNLERFLHLHGTYESEMPRVPGERLFRGTKALLKELGFLTAWTAKNKKALLEGTTNISLTTKRVRNAGMYYRAFETELPNAPAMFEAEVEEIFRHRKTYADYPNTSRSRSERSQIRNYILADYAQWKAAFYQ